MITNRNDDVFPTTDNTLSGGLTKREHFAALALQGLLAAAGDMKGNLNTGVPSVAPIYARMAVGLADALIEALNVKE